MPRPALLLAALAAACVAADLPAKPDPAKKPAWFAKAVKGFAVTCDPPEARPGETVTLKVTLHLNDGYTTYPLKQADEAAAGMVSKLEFPKPSAVVFVGDAADPADPKTKAEPLLGIEKLAYYAGKVVWERKFVVNPNQPAGELTVTLPAVKPTVCDAANCFPPRAFTADAKLTVKPGPAAVVEAKYAEEVAKALAGK